MNYSEVIQELIEESKTQKLLKQLRRFNSKELKDQSQDLRLLSLRLEKTYNLNLIDINLQTKCLLRVAYQRDCLDELKRYKHVTSFLSLAEFLEYSHAKEENLQTLSFDGNSLQRQFEYNPEPLYLTLLDKRIPFKNWQDWI